MKPRLRAASGWLLLAVGVGSGAGTIGYILWGGSVADRPDRAQVWGTVWAVATAVLGWAWSRLCQPATDPAGPGVSTPEQAEAAAELLATRMFATWSRQATTWGIRLPAPVRVRWRWAASQVAVPRAEVNASPAGFNDPPPIPGTGVGEVLSSGVVTRLHGEVYARLRHGRLVLIGGPGAGKTAAMILLLLAALHHRRQADEGDRAKVPVPVWLTLGSWDPHAQGLREWVTATIARDHPYLRAAVFGPDVIGALFDTGKIALFLDGLDELPDAHRSQAIHRLRTEAGGLRVALTSRPDEYRATLDDGAHLPETAVIELRPVGVNAAVDYLLADRTDPARRAWTAVTERMRTEPAGVLARTLNSPLTLSLARAAHPVDPAPLLGPALDTEQALRRHLLDQTLVTAYPDPRERAHATYWLGWIAHHMNTQPTGPTRDLPWWHIPNWIPRWQRRLGFGPGFGLVFGFMGGLVGGLGFGLGFGLVIGLVAGLIGGLVGGRGVSAPQTFVVHRPSRQELQSVLRVGLLVGLLFGLLGGFAFGLAGGLMVGLGLGGGVGLVFGLGVGLLMVWSDPAADSAEATPRSTHHQDVQTQVVFGLVVGLVCGPLYGFMGGLVDLRLGGFLGGLVFGFVYGFVGSAAPEMFLAEAVLAAGGRRVRFMRLLQTALDRQVLRQAGAVYQFRHADLQDRLTERFARDRLRAGAPAEALPSGAGRGPDIVDLTTPAPAAATGEGAGSAAGE
jgi:hypothetical protein